MQWPCNADAPLGTPLMHGRLRARGKGGSSIPNISRPRNAAAMRFPLLLTTGRILSQYNVGAQTRRTANEDLAP